MHQGCQCGNHIGAAGTHLNAQGSLPGRWQHHRRIKQGTDARGQPQAFESRRSQHNRVIQTVIELAQTGVEITAQWLNLQVWAQCAQQGHAAQAGGSHHRPLRQGIQAGIPRRDKRITRVFPLHDTCQLKAVGQLHRHVLERMHRQIGPTVFECDLKLLDKQAFATYLAQCPVKNLVAQGGHSQQVNLVTELPKKGLNMFGLPHGQTAFSGGNGKFTHKQRHAAVTSW
ncbi:hypothetical protein GALL_542870 [mine drainage metagenome]|uniref:Uncharacterized protein n=1 Tax=mine drainage metagenome TaxID=410659 RepID=A0A1J5PFY6_9ZZZZ